MMENNIIKPIRFISPEITGDIKTINLVYNPITDEGSIVSDEDLEKMHNDPENVLLAISGKDTKDLFSTRLFSSDYNVTCPECNGNIPISLQDMITKMEGL